MRYKREQATQSGKTGKKKRSALKTLAKQIRDFLRIARYCHRNTPLPNPEYFKLFLRALHLCYQKQFSPKEALRLRLLDPQLPPGQLSKYISKKNLRKLQLSLNPIPWGDLAKDKGIFHRYCMALAIPVPKLYAIFFRTTAGWSYNGDLLTSRREWENFFDTQLPAEFVIKPARGSLGEDVNVFKRANKEFIDSFGKSYQTHQLYNHLLAHKKYHSFIIQQRLKNHPELIRLSNVQFLQTVRIITIIDKNNHCCISHAHLKLITGQNVTDNFRHGLSGNIEVEVSPDDGTLGPAVMIPPGGLVIKNVHNHPKTGLSFDQFRLPLWNEACSLVKKTAFRFPPLRAIGWDVALTPDGPLILEANLWWPPPNEFPSMSTVLEDLSRSV